MLPTPRGRGASLADVLEDSLAAVRGERNGLSLPPVDRAVVVLVDGLGAENLRAAAGHARTLAGAMRTKSDVIATGAPTTTAAAIATLTTGALPGAHGMVSYSALDPERDVVMNQLRGLDDLEQPEDWMLVPTVFERAASLGLDALAVGHERYRDSGYTRAVLRGAEYLGGRTPADRVDALLERLGDSSWRGIGYLYAAEIDMAGHDEGWRSREWSDALEAVDAAVATLVGALDARTGLLVTADHGMVDVAPHGRLVIPDASPLWSGVRHVGGEHRLLHLYLEPDADAGECARRWAESEGERAWVATRAAAIEAGWFGDVADVVRPRIGDVLVAARKDVAFYTEEALAGSAGSMVGQHGSWSPAEQRVPLLRFGAFTR